MVTDKIVLEKILLHATQTFDPSEIPLPDSRRYCEVAVIKPSGPYSYDEPPFRRTDESQ